MHSKALLPSIPVESVIVDIVPVDFGIVSAFSGSFITFCIGSDSGSGYAAIGIGNFSRSSASFASSAAFATSSAAFATGSAAFATASGGTAFAAGSGGTAFAAGSGGTTFAAGSGGTAFATGSRSGSGSSRTCSVLSCNDR